MRGDLHIGGVMIQLVDSLGNQLASRHPSNPDFPRVNI